MRQNRFPSRQRGLVLVLSLIVLVLMLIAGIALARAVGVTNQFAGNIAFKQGALSATDLGMQTAMAKFSSSGSGYLATDSQTYSDSTANCYSASAFNKDASSIAKKGVDPRGVPNILLNRSTFDSTYSSCKFSNSDTAETIRYVIDRQCSTSAEGAAASETYCNVYAGSATSGSVSTSTTATGAEIVPLYRISVRVDGPRNTVSYAQVLIRP